MQQVDLWVLIATSAASGLLGGVLVALVGARSAALRDKRADQRGIRDRKARRLRAAFQPTLHMAMAWEENLRLQPFGYSTETDEARRERFDRALQAAGAVLVDAQIALFLEPEVGESIHEHFRNVHRAFVEYHSLVALRKELKDEGVPPNQRPKITELPAKEREASAAVDELKTAMLRVLRDLEQPV